MAWPMLLLMNLVEPELEVFDEEGVDLPDLQTARKVALCAAQDILAADLRAGLPLFLDRHIDITNASGKTLLTVEFSDAIEIVH